MVTGICRVKTDGLNWLKYKVLQRDEKPLYTWVLVEINEEEVLAGQTKSSGL